MTNDQLLALARAALADEKRGTPGPWVTDVWCNTNGPGVVPIGPVSVGAFDDEPGAVQYIRAETDARIIAAARTREPHLAKAVVAMLAELDYLADAPGLYGDPRTVLHVVDKLRTALAGMGER